MLAGRAIHADAARAVQHLPVAADIDAAGVGRGGQRDVAGADVAAAVAGPEFRRREFRQVDVVAAQHDLVDRRLAISAPAPARSCRFMMVRDSAIISAIERSGIEADRERIALLAGAQHVGEHARAGFVAGDVLEQQRRRLLAARRHVGDGGKLLVGGDLLADALQFAVPLDQRHPFAQVAPARLAGRPWRWRAAAAARRCGVPCVRAYRRFAGRRSRAVTGIRPGCRAAARSRDRRGRSPPRGRRSARAARPGASWPGRRPSSGDSIARSFFSQASRSAA